MLDEKRDSLSADAIAALEKTIEKHKSGGVELETQVMKEIWSRLTVEARIDNILDRVSVKGKVPDDLSQGLAYLSR